MATENDTTRTGHTNPDAITGAPGSHPGATAIGSGSGAVTGAALGALGGPIGAVIGGVAGAIVGGGVGHGIGEGHDPSDMAYWEDEYKNRSYYDESANYDRDVAPAYGYGSSLAASSTGTPASGGGTGTFSNIESQARQGWEKVRGTSSMSYDQVRNHIQDAYERKAKLGNTGTVATGASRATDTSNLRTIL